MMNPSRFLVASLLAVFATATLPAQTFEALKGSCDIGVSTRSDQFEFHLERGVCPKDTSRGDADDVFSNRDERRNCNTTETQEPFNAFTGFVESDLGRDGAHLDAVLNAEAGTLVCSGTVHNFKLSGDFTFTPNAAFAAHMLKLGIQDITSRNLMAYTLFRVAAANVEALQRDGVTGIDAKNLASLSIFHVTTAFVEGIRALGYPTPPAPKLVALKIHGVNPEEVRQIRALGYQPTIDELIKMRIFKITPGFIQDMKSRGFGSSPQDLTIARLVKIKIFKLDE